MGFPERREAAPLLVQVAQCDGQSGTSFQAGGRLAQRDERATLAQARAFDAGHQHIGIEAGYGDGALHGGGARHGERAEARDHVLVGLAQACQAPFQGADPALQGGALTGQVAAERDLAAERQAEAGNLGLEPGLLGEAAGELRLEVPVGRALTGDRVVLCRQDVPMRDIAGGREHRPAGKGAERRRGELLAAARQAEIGDLATRPQDHLARHEDPVHEARRGAPGLGEAHRTLFGGG